LLANVNITGDSRYRRGQP